MRAPRGAALLAGLAVLALSGRRSTAGASTAGPSTGGGGGGNGRALPWLYGRAKLPMLRTRYQLPDLRAAVERFGAHYLPGTPTTALIAAGATSTGPTEHGGPPDYATGYFGVEWQWWQRVAGDAETRSILGREGPATYAGFDRDIEAQAFAGMRTYARHLAMVRAQLAARGRPELARGDAAWAYRLAVAGYSAGPGTVVGTIVGALADQTATGATWRELAAAVDHLCPDCAGHVGAVPCCGRWKAADVVIRCDGRWEAGRYLAGEVAIPELRFYEAGAIASLEEQAVARRLTSRVNGV